MDKSPPELQLPSYQEWRAMPESLEKWAFAAYAYMKPGEYGPWPVNVEKDDILRGLWRFL